MKGLRLTIAKHTINTILDTLGESDFVNLIVVRIEILYTAAAEGRGSLCNQAIMLITDGAMEDFQQVRMFTYLFGRELTFADNVKWIACYYTQISTLADVQENVMEYLHVLKAYMDIPFNTQAESLLLMPSVAMPVFSKKEETGQGSCSTPLSTLFPLKILYLNLHILPIRVDYILYHIKIDVFFYNLCYYKNGKKLKPKPNCNSVDLSEVEWEDTDDALRTAMVKGESGTLSLDIRATVEKGFTFVGFIHFYLIIT
uniref:Uncharacterized protein n=1 Tax=Cyprinus carpio TaxID=7962 RepID=A0A8C2GJJ2_CYPCA